MSKEVAKQESDSFSRYNGGKFEIHRRTGLGLEELHEFIVHLIDSGSSSRPLQVED
jgi:hypothetical protein